MKMSRQEREKKAMTKDRLIGMQVIDSEGNDAGTVQDIAFTVGKVGMTLIIETKKGETREVPWEEIQAAGDFVILKPVAATVAQPQAFAAQPTPQAQAQAQTPTCPTCGGPLTYVQQYQRWYCYKDKKYV
ncbi:MAG TPA: PRC-barrel domain-containing protein [Candidatus Bathyarchaeia archaeon]